MLITSYHDENYYVMSNKDAFIFYIETLLLENGQKDCSDILSQYWHWLREGYEFSNLIILKKSTLGRTLTSFIKKEKLFDERYMIRKDILVNSLIRTIQEKEYRKEYQYLIKELIELDIEGESHQIAQKYLYSQSKLENIIKLGRCPSYLLQLSPAVSGFESEGLLEKEGTWYQFNLLTKEMIPLTEKKKEEKNNTSNLRRKLSKCYPSLIDKK